MKKTVAGLILGLLLVPSFAFAQVVPPQDASVLVAELRQQLIELLQAQVAILVARLEVLEQGQDEIKEQIAEEDEEDTGAGVGAEAVEDSCDQEVLIKDVDVSRTTISRSDDGTRLTIDLESSCEAIKNQEFKIDSPNQYDLDGIPNVAVHSDDDKKATVRASFYVGALEPGVYSIKFSTSDDAETVNITVE